MSATNLLADDQVATFDRPVDDRYWAPVARNIDRDFPDGRFSFLDVGGGNGSFSDMVLTCYPHALGTLVDTSEFMLSRNVPSPRKTTVLGDAMRLDKCQGQFDIVFCNWLLHHLVLSGNYRATRGNINAVLSSIRARLTDRGRLSIFEQEYNGFVDEFPSRIIFALTSLRFLAPLTKRLGANTAGVGVCFLSQRAWRREMHQAGYVLRSQTEIRKRRSRPLRHAALLVKRETATHYWLSKS